MTQGAPVTAIRTVLLIGVLAACAGTAAPGASTGSPVTEAEARAMTENMLAAYNSGDYAAWSKDWSSTMKSAITEQAFREFQRASMLTTGSFKSIDSITSRPGEKPGVTRWESTVTFENGRYLFMIAFDSGSKQIEGVNLSPAP